MQYKEFNRSFVFMDESWLNKNMKPTKLWYDGGLDLEPTATSGKGVRWIVIGAGGTMGWIPNSVRMWSGVKKHVREHNFNENMERIKELAFEKIELQNGPNNTAAHWNASFNHTMNFINKQVEIENAEDEPVVVEEVLVDNNVEVHHQINLDALNEDFQLDDDNDNINKENEDGYYSTVLNYVNSLFI